jgi:hypothetical protein
MASKEVMLAIEEDTTHHRAGNKHSISCERFKDKFNKRFFSWVVQEAKARELMNLVQCDAQKFQNLKKENTINRKQLFLFINFIIFHLLQIV